MIRIMLVDDHPVVRAGVRALLDGQHDMDVVGEAATAGEALELARGAAPQVALMDLSLGDGPGGAAATRSLRELPDPPEVLILTTYDTEADILEAIDAGAAGYLLKDAPPDELFRAVRATARGETVLAPAVAARLMRRASSADPLLSAREIDIVRLLAKGLGNREMARELLISEATVKSHLTHIYTKLGVDTRAAAVAVAIERRILRP
jgi:DNA-binding NarL/FixJ family response regulator